MIRSSTMDNAIPEPHRTHLEFLRRGRPSAPQPLAPLQAGPIRLLCDVTNPSVRHLRLGDREVLRGIYAAVRDQNWGTVPGVVRQLRSKVGQDHFELEFETTHRQDNVHFVWRGVVHGDPDGTVQFDFDGEAKTTFLRNRIGFCVLHPIRECAGVLARQTRSDGHAMECRFPTNIEPQIFGQASFQDLRAVAHEIEPGIWAEVTFEGEVFEMEDQRNWTDASFKTYCTPLILPFPVEIPAGTRVQQRVCFRLAAVSATLSPRPALLTDETPRVTVVMPSAPAGRVPSIGFCDSNSDLPLTPGEVARCRALAPAHLRVDVKLAASDWGMAWDHATQRANELGVGIELALHLPREVAPDLNAVAEALRRAGVPLVRVMALREGEIATRPQTLVLLRQHLAGLDIPIGGGSDCNFCELNREQALGHFALTDSEFVFWSINPQVHAVDDLSLIESLEAQGDTVLSARAFAGDRPLLVSPLTFKQRFNPVATGPEPHPPPGHLPPQVDPRQLSLFGAGWTVGSLAALSCAGVESVTMFETTGWRGLMEAPAGSLVPDRFPSRPGQVFPLYHVFTAIAGCPSTAPARVSDPLAVTALALFDRADQPRLLLANVTDSSRTVRISGWPTPMAHLRLLDETNAVAMTDDPDSFTAHPGQPVVPQTGILTLQLPPFAFARIEAVAPSSS
jgi:D-apionolactonase